MEIFLMNRYKIDPRRLPELKDSRMIQEDQTAMANCPTYPINREFNEAALFQNPYNDYDDIGPFPPRIRRA